MDSKITYLVVIMVAFALSIFLILVISGNYSFRHFKAKEVGNGQYGTSKFLDNSSLRKYYDVVEFNPKDWRKGKNLPKKDGVIIGAKWTFPDAETFEDDIVDSKNTVEAIIDRRDVHTLMLAASGIGKTTCFVYPNIEYQLARGISIFCTDTKGDVYRKYGAIAKKYYGYEVAVLDLRNPMESDEYNFLSTLNYYMDLSLENEKKYKECLNNNDKVHANQYKADYLRYKGKTEKYAKIIAKTIIYSEGDQNYGQNQFFYDAAEGIITSVCLLVSEFGNDSERHIVTVFKVIQDLLAPAKGGPSENKFKAIMKKLPSDHKAKWFSGAALNTADQSMASVLSTAMARMISFLDSELEQMLCFHTSIDAKKFADGKCLICLNLPEEDPPKFFMASLIIQSLFREFIIVADEKGGKNDKMVLFILDEIGTIPEIQGLSEMFSAIRSRNARIIAIIQSLCQFKQKYTDEGAKIILSNCQDVINGPLAPLDEDADLISEALGSNTVLSGSISKQRDQPSTAQLSMIERKLMFASELKQMDIGNYVVQKTGASPLKTKLKLFKKWGIELNEEYTMKTKQVKEVHFMDVNQMEDSIIEKYGIQTEIPKVVNSKPDYIYSHKEDKTTSKSKAVFDKLLESSSRLDSNTDISKFMK